MQNSLIRRRIVHPSIELRRQHAVRDGARVAQLQLRTAHGARLRGNRKRRVDLPALERRCVIGCAERGDIELQCDDGRRLEQHCSQ